MDFITDRLENGRYLRTLTVVDQYTRECPVLEAAHSLTAAKVVDALDTVAAKRGYPESITVDNGSEFCSRVLDGWAYRHGVKLDFIRTESGYQLCEAVAAEAAAGVPFDPSSPESIQPPVP